MSFIRFSKGDIHYRISFGDNSILHLLLVNGDPQGVWIVSIFSNNLDGLTGNHTVEITIYLICTDYADVNIQDFCKIKLVLVEKF